MVHGIGGMFGVKSQDIPAGWCLADGGNRLHGCRVSKRGASNDVC
jgi:hypothetical protein